ncbi:unnamed protein product [Schistocephalus solidus]|uniref:C2H2-type domain-containing protein n=1 Tax=Schistocephalus solidus TaxID=70667 RepID=A0A183SIU4_SCHSO|nr:unnamed protein product [Schistocephalus solidus]
MFDASDGQLSGFHGTAIATGAHGAKRVRPRGVEDADDLHLEEQVDSRRLIHQRSQLSIPHQLALKVSQLIDPGGQDRGVSKAMASSSSANSNGTYIGPAARRLQNYNYQPAQSKFMQAETAQTLEEQAHISSRSPSACVGLRRQHSSSAQAPKALSRSMTADTTLSPVRNFRPKSRLHRSTGSISLASSAAGSATEGLGAEDGLSTILSDSCSSSKDTSKHKGNHSSGGGGNKPRHLKRLRNKAVAEPETVMTGADSLEEHVSLVKTSSLVYSKSSTPVGQDSSHKSHRRTRSASGSTTKLASFWSFLFSGAGGRHKQHAVAPLASATAVVASSSGTTVKQIKSGAFHMRLWYRKNSRTPDKTASGLRTSMSHYELNGVHSSRMKLTAESEERPLKSHSQERPRSEGKLISLFFLFLDHTPPADCIGP